MVREKKSILDSFPYPSTIREQQREALLAIEKYWEKYDIFCIVAPTASGKSAISKAIAAWRHNAAIITPTNLLVSQYCSEFPEMSKLFKRELYLCPRFANGMMNCKDASSQYKKKLGCSRKCAYVADNMGARGRGYLVCNYYTYMSNKLFKPTLIVDEAHNILKVSQDLCGQKIWRHDWHYPWDMWTHADILNWVESYNEEQLEYMQEKKRLVLGGLKEELTSQTPRYILKRGYETWAATTPPEERELLTMLPVDVRDAPPFLWPSQVGKIVLLSATISHKDIESLGLDRRRVLYLEVNSPIPPTSRPIITDFVGDVNRNNLKDLTILMAKKVVEDYLPRYIGKKGMIHATYSQAKLFKEYFMAQSPEIADRFIFHDRTNTKQQYKYFLDSPPESGKVFVASGLYEGIDLANDLGRWQVVAKIPWLNLGDPAIRYKATQDNSWYTWCALKDTMQVCGRISRNENDFGTTYFMDASFTRLVKKGFEYSLIPEWWREVLPSDVMRGLY